MRERQHLVIDRQTGDATLTTETVDGDADFAQRVRELKDSLPDISPGSTRFAIAACDGCGTTVALDFAHPEMPAG